MNLADKTGMDPKALAVTGFKAANAILLSWGCTEQQSQNILGLSEPNLDRFKSNPNSAKLTDDQLIRVSHLLGIHQALRVLFSNPANIKAFMGMVNHDAYFDGRKPIEIIASGRVEDLHEVAKRIDLLISDAVPNHVNTLCKETPL